MRRPASGGLAAAFLAGLLAFLPGGTVGPAATLGWGAAGLDAQQVLAGAPGEVLRAAGGMVVSEHPEASRAGAAVLARGGNAVDAAVATGFALAVTHPSAGNIGGGGFMIVRFPDGTATTLDFREAAPGRAHPEMWLEDGEYSAERHHYSHRAVGVPGTVAGFEKAHRLYGRTPWTSVVEPAVRLARDGFPLSERLAGSLASMVRRFAHYPATVAAFSREGVPYRAGEVLRQPDLALTLARIRDLGAWEFYQGETARLVVAEMERGGGLLTAEDLARYRPRERTPVTVDFRGYRVISMPPPSSGGVAVASMLNILEPLDLEGMGHNSADYLHHLAEAMWLAFRDRARYLGDTDFVDVPVHALTSKAHAAELRATIDPDRASVSSPLDVAGAVESAQTTHYSVVDGSGMAVSVTYTLEAGYGSGIVVPEAGFLLNNEMGDFNAGPGLTDANGLIGTEPNLARPGQRMLSSMSPAIVARDGALVAVVGSPGGRTIINTVLQVILNLTAFGMDLPEALAAPRIHHQWLPDRIVVEAEGFAPEALAGLEARGHTVLVRGRQGLAHSILADPATGVLTGAPDPRNPDAGAAAVRR
ncbi:MAG: gamma-glutamyltransferase [Longimicrobiales bacterium]|nr:gamma-glutamyltransferase [Longimicrobiales bacterium]